MILPSITFRSEKCGHEKLGVRGENHNFRLALRANRILRIFAHGGGVLDMVEDFRTWRWIFAHAREL